MNVPVLTKVVNSTVKLSVKCTGIIGHVSDVAFLIIGDNAIIKSPSVSAGISGGGLKSIVYIGALEGAPRAANKLKGFP